MDTAAHLNVSKYKKPHQFVFKICYQHNTGTGILYLQEITIKNTSQLIGREFAMQHITAGILGYFLHLLYKLRDRYSTTWCNQETDFLGEKKIKNCLVLQSLACLISEIIHVLMHAVRWSNAKHLEKSRPYCLGGWTSVRKEKWILQKFSCSETVTNDAPLLY